MGDFSPFLVGGVTPPEPPTTPRPQKAVFFYPHPQTLREKTNFFFPTPPPEKRIFLSNTPQNTIVSFILPQHPNTPVPPTPPPGPRGGGVRPPSHLPGYRPTPGEHPGPPPKRAKFSLPTLRAEFFWHFWQILSKSSQNSAFGCFGGQNLSARRFAIGRKSVTRTAPLFRRGAGVNFFPGGCGGCGWGLGVFFPLLFRRREGWGTWGL